MPALRDHPVVRSMGPLRVPLTGWHDDLSQRHVVIGQKHDLQQAAHRRIGIDNSGYVDGELDDQLGLSVARGRFAREDLDPRRKVEGRVRSDGIVPRDRLEKVEQLTLVFMYPLDLHVEHRFRVDAQIELIANDARKRGLAIAASLSHPLVERRIVRARRKALP